MKFARVRLKRNKREIKAVCATELLRKDTVSGKSLHGLIKNLYKTLEREAFRVTKQKKGGKKVTFVKPPKPKMLGTGRIFGGIMFLSLFLCPWSSLCIYL